MPSVSSSSPLVLVKVSGKVIDDPVARTSFAGWVEKMVSRREQLVLVHGGGRQIDELSAKQGIEPIRIDGRRVTDPATLEIVKMTLGGTVNLSLVSALAARGVCAVGLSGASAGIVRALRRPPQLRLDAEGRGYNVDFGLVGDIVHVNGKLLLGMLEMGAIPVIASLGIDEDGQVLNVNADSVAEAIAIELKCSQVLMVGDTNGIYRDFHKPESRIPRIAAGSLQDLVTSGVVSGGMFPKIAACRRMCEAGVAEVVLCQSPEVSMLGAQGRYSGGTVVHL